MTPKIRVLWQSKRPQYIKMDGKGDGPREAAVSLSRRDFRAMIYYDFLQGKDYRQSHESLCKCFRDKAPSLATVNRWFNAFVRGETSLDDDNRCGRPATVNTDKTVEIVKRQIIEDPRITENEMKETLKISSGTLDRVLRHELFVRKRCAR